ncbi:MAG TPA: M43 family zinc metalloprotease [Saprospiraceae bacterium]|nr:M43 family zinc metalloprotease [Saprospiraceae bacterium]
MGQTSHPKVFCGNEIFSDIIREHYPDFEKAINRTFENAKQSSVSARNETLTIPVVVHVVWKEEAENLDESIILDQMRILNEDYTRLNADTVNLRPVFQNEAGAANIHFELAEIVRVQTDQLFAVDLLGTNLLAEAKHSDAGGSDAWDTESYLNIWIVNIQPIEIFGIVVGQILGFAFPPNGLENWPEGSASPAQEEDGVVLDYRIVGSNNPNTIENPNMPGTMLTIKGRSATHEVGHYLGLRHIWGDGGLLGPNDCLQSDGIDDTPFADSQSAFDCNTSKNSCAQIEAHYNLDMPDLIENYMDYSSEECMNMFTHGQVELMRNVLSGPRSGLIENVSSTQDLNNNLDFTIAPNPTDDVSTIYFEVESKTEITVRISDISGHLTLANIRQEYLPGEHELSVSFKGFSPGIYFIELISKEGVSVRKLVLR